MTDVWRGLAEPPKMLPVPKVAKPRTPKAPKVRAERVRKEPKPKRERKEIVSRWPIIANPWELSSSQYECLRRVVEGCATESIADAMCITIKTVCAHLGRAKEKMGVRTLLAAALTFDRHTRGLA